MKKSSSQNAQSRKYTENILQRCIAMDALADVTTKSIKNIRSRESLNIFDTTK